jgi:hypothetical protein
VPFLSEPEHQWCYYFAKAELAYQQKNWKKVIDLIDQAKSLGFGPEDPFEWLTYIEAQALMGNIQTAVNFSTDAFKQESGIRKGLCEVWKRVQTQSHNVSEDETPVKRMLSNFQCAE